MADTKVPGQGGVTPDAVRAKIKVEPKFQSAFDRVVAAGRKLLYSPQMAPQIQQQMQGAGTPGEKIGKGVVGLLAILIDKSNGTLPPQIVIPAATVLVAEAGDLLQASESDIAEGMAVMVEEVLSMAGIGPEQLPQLLKQGGAPTQAPPQATPEAGGGMSEE